MYVCKCWLDLHLFEQPGSLKGKRQVIHRLRDRLINRFPISVAVVGDNNLWQRAELGIAFVTSDRDRAEAIWESIYRAIVDYHPVEIVDCFRELEKIK